MFEDSKSRMFHHEFHYCENLKGCFQHVGCGQCFWKIWKIIAVKPHRWCERKLFFFNLSLFVIADDILLKKRFGKKRKYSTNRIGCGNHGLWKFIGDMMPEVNTFGQVSQISKITGSPSTRISFLYLMTISNQIFRYFSTWQFHIIFRYLYTGCPKKM